MDARVIAVPGSTQIIDEINPETGKTAISNQTIEQFMRTTACKNAVVMTYDDFLRLKGKHTQNTCAPVRNV